MSGGAHGERLKERCITTTVAVGAKKAPESRMDILRTEEIDRIIKKSHLALKYNQVIDRESAYEILNRKVAQIADQKQKESNQKSTVRTTRSKKSSQSEVGKQVVKVLTSATFIRGAFGVLNKLFKK